MNIKKVFSMILSLCMLLTIFSGTLTVSADNDVTAKNYLSGIYGLSYFNYVTLEDQISPDLAVTNRRIEIYDASELCSMYHNDWEKMILPIRNAFKKIGGIESSGIDGYGDREYYYMVDENSYSYKGFRLLGKTASQKIINESGIIYIECCRGTEILKDMNGISFKGADYVYDGTKKRIAVSGTLPEGALVTYKNANATNAGTYNATAIVTCYGYKDLTLNAKFTIKPAEISVKADDAQIVKGEKIPELKYTVTNGKLFGNDKITGTLKTNADGKKTGNFDITQGTLSAGNNYKINFTKGTLSVVNKTPQNIAVSKISEKTYGDEAFKLEVTKDALSNLDAFTFESSNTDVAEISADGIITIKNAGETDITVKELGDDIYAPFSETQKLVVKKVPITITAKNTSKKIGTADPKLEFDYAGTFVGDDGFSGELTRQPGEEVGKYDILIGTLAINDNYEITYNKGIFEIFDKTPQNISVVDFGEKTYGDEAFKISATADEKANLSNFSYESDNKDVAEVTADGTITIKAAGEANIKVKEPGNDDYAAFEKTIKLVVKKKGVEIKSINIDDKTAALDGVLTEDTDKVTVDFEKVTVDITGEADETSSNVILKNFTLKGEKAANYEIITNDFESVIANDKIVNVSVKGENCVLTGGAKYLKGTSVTVTAAPESRYRFRGWYIGDTQVSDKAEYTFTAEEDIELTAKCTRKRSSSSSGSTGGSISGGSSSYTINFATNGGSEMKSIGVKANQAIGEIAEPTKEGYVFTGWYSDKELTKPLGKEDKITASVTLYAGWKIDPVRQLILTIGEKSAKAFGKDVENDVAPIIRNDRTMLPARFVAENLGAKVLWDEDKQLVTVSGKNEKDEDVTILITIGADTAIVNGEEIKLDSPAFIENDRTYTPVRFIAEQLGTSVEWNEEAKTVTITK